jgi:hypothetical protein
MFKLSTESIYILAAVKKHFALPANQIAISTRIPATKLKEHLNILILQKYISSEKYGAHIYYKGNEEFINTLDNALLEDAMTNLKELPTLEESTPLRKARTCYGHLAGILGVNIKKKFIEDGFIEVINNDYQLTKQGIKRFSDFGLEQGNPKRRKVDTCAIKPCLDWTERQYHLAGNFGKTFSDHLINLGWLKRCSNSRALQITQTGEKGFAAEFSLKLDHEYDPRNIRKYSV